MADYPFWDEGIHIHYEFDKRTVHGDWDACLNKTIDKIDKMSKNIETLREIKILDIGCGDGSTTKQLLDKILKISDFKIVLDVVEPSKVALSRFNKSKEKFSTKVTVRKIINNLWKPNLLDEKYDLIFLIHTAYYIADSEEEYREMIKSILNLLNNNGICIIFLMPEDSGFYNIAGLQMFGNWVYSEKTKEIINKLGYAMDSFNCKIRIFVQDFFTDDKKLQNFWRFIVNNPAAGLTKSKKNKLINKLKKLSKTFQGKYIGFKDEIIFISKTARSEHST